jgi:hypothetical protein
MTAAGRGLTAGELEAWLPHPRGGQGRDSRGVQELRALRPPLAAALPRRPAPRLCHLEATLAAIGSGVSPHGGKNPPSSTLSLGKAAFPGRLPLLAPPRAGRPPAPLVPRQARCGPASSCFGMLGPAASQNGVHGRRTEGAPPPRMQEGCRGRPRAPRDSGSVVH